MTDPLKRAREALRLHLADFDAGGRGVRYLAQLDAALDDLEAQLFPSPPMTMR